MVHSEISAAFVRAARHVRREEKLSANDAGAVLSGYLSGVERLNAYLDRYDSTT